MALSTAFAPRIMQYVTVTSAATSADANDANDVLFDKTLVSGVSWAINRPVMLNSLVYIDAAAQAAAALTFWFFDVNITTFGTADAAPSISDGDAASFLGQVVLPSANQTVLANNTLGSIHNLNMILKPVANTSGLYIAATTAGTGNYAGGTVTVRLGFIS